MRKHSFITMYANQQIEKNLEIVGYSAIVRIEDILSFSQHVIQSYMIIPIP